MCYMCIHVTCSTLLNTAEMMFRNVTAVIVMFTSVGRKTHTGPEAFSQTVDLSLKSTQC